MSPRTTHPKLRSMPQLLDQLGPGNYTSIASAAGLHQQHVSRVLRGIKGCSFRVAHKIAHAADVTLDELWHYIVTRPTYQNPGMRTRGERAA